MKYTEQFKLAAITAYLEGSDGFRKVAQHFNIDFSLLRRWVASYKARSTISSIPHSQRYHIDFKRRVVQHMREHRLSLRQTAAHFGLGQSSRIGIWEDQYYRVHAGSDGGGAGLSQPGSGRGLCAAAARAADHQVRAPG